MRDVLLPLGHEGLLIARSASKCYDNGLPAFRQGTRLERCEAEQRTGCRRARCGTQEIPPIPGD
jgi:hypothetical protein